MKTAAFIPDPLFELERKIARRADALTRERGCDPQHALERWREAEREVWDNYSAEHDSHPVECAQTVH
jgi:hypothetical protein